MTNYIPDELYNLIEYPITGLESTTVDSLVGEMLYKLPKAPDIVVKKELWHAICDFCGRTGALLDKCESSTGLIEIKSNYGDFMRVVGCLDPNGYKTSAYEWSNELSQSGYKQLMCPSTGGKAVISVRPRLDNNETTSDVWTPHVPKYLLDWYGECIMHGALMRVFVMNHEPWCNIDLARAHAVAYNNDMTRISYGLITSGMRKHMLVDVEDFIITGGANGNG